MRGVFLDKTGQRVFVGYGRSQESALGNATKLCVVKVRTGSAIVMI